MIIRRNMIKKLTESITKYFKSITIAKVIGVAPYDYLALGMTDAFKPPYFVNRIITDGTCVCLIVLIVLMGLLLWAGCHLGLGTVLCAFCFGPIIHFFNRFSAKWIK